MKNTLFIFFMLAAVWIHAADRPNILFCCALAILMHVQKMVAASLLTFTNPHPLQVRVIQRLRLNSVTA